MTTAPVISLTDELIAEIEAAATGIKGWTLPDAFVSVGEGFNPDEWDWSVGRIDEEDNQYPVMTVDTMQYDADDAEKLAKYYALVNRDAILALLAERSELKRDADRYRWLCESVWYVGPEPRGDIEAVSWHDKNDTIGGVTQAIDAAMQEKDQ